MQSKDKRGDIEVSDPGSPRGGPVALDKRVQRAQTGLAPLGLTRHGRPMRCPPRRLFTIVPVVFLSGIVLPAKRAQAQGAADVYQLDPVTDTIVLGASLIASIGSQITIDSGELQAVAPGPIANIPFYDRWVAEGASRESGDWLSDLGVALAIGYGAFDVVRAGLSDGVADSGTTAVLYAQSALFNWAVANVFKLTVRRPRPSAYATEGGDGNRPEKNRELSFYSGHTAVTAGMVGTAGYLLFQREGPSAAAWSALVVGTAVTAFVGANRVRANAHFPSDVVVGAVVGASIGILVPHIHRRDPDLPVAAAPTATSQPLTATVRFAF